MLINSKSLSQFKRENNISEMVKSETIKEGRKYIFLSFSTTFGEKTALVSEAAIPDYENHNFTNLMISEICDDSTGEVLPILSIHRKPENKEIVNCDW